MYPAESGVALEFTAAGLLRVLKATGKMGVDAVKEHSANLSENMVKMRRLGRGAMHGLPHAVEGVTELLHGRSLPPERGEAIGKVGRDVIEGVGSHAIGIIEHDRQRFHSIRDLSAGVHGYWKGTSSKLDLTEIETEAGITQRTSANLTGSPATQLPDGTAENIRQLAGKLKVKHFQYTEDIDAAEAYARRLGLSNVDYGGNSQVANVSNLGLQRLQNRNALRAKRGLEPLPIPDSIRVDSITSGATREAPAQFVVPAAGDNSIGLTLNSNHVYW